MAYNNLYEYYSANGGWNTWDSPQRQADAKAAGITNYTGTAEQNKILLDYLTKQKGTAPASQPTPPPAPTSTGVGFSIDVGGKGGVADAVRQMISNAGNFPAYKEDPRIQPLLDKISQSGVDMDTLINRATSELGSISSSQSEVDQYINQAIETQNKFRESVRTAAEQQFNRESDYTLQKLDAERTALLESGRGNAQQYYVMQLLEKETEKSLRDLESRKLEAIASGDAKAYEVISNLQLKQLELRQNARQKYFENLVSMAGMESKKSDMYSSMLSNIRQMNTDRLNYEIENYKARISEANTIADAMVNEAHLRIAARELALRERENSSLNLLPSPGWATFELQDRAGGILNDSYSKIAERLKSGEYDSMAVQLGLSSPEQVAFLELEDAAKSMERQVGPNATPRAIREMLGGVYADSGEFIGYRVGNMLLTREGQQSQKNSPFWDMILNPSPTNIYNNLYKSILNSLPIPGGPAGRAIFDLLTIDPNTGDLRTPDGRPVVEKKNR
jgi:hypothetical protein